MARMSVEGTGINRLENRKAVGSAFVDLDWMALQARFCRLLIVGDVESGFGTRGIFQRLLVRLRWTVMIILTYLIIFTLYLENISTQSSY